MIEYNGLNLKDINDEYKIDKTDIFTDLDENYIKLINIIDNKLTKAERIIILMYAELQSIRKVGQVLGVSQSTAYNELTRIKNIIKSFI